jgi:hypothetical protein
VRVAGVSSPTASESTGASMYSAFSRVGVRCGLRRPCADANAEFGCTVPVGVTSSLGGIIPGEGSGKAPGIRLIAGVTAADLS